MSLYLQSPSPFAYLSDAEDLLLKYRDQMQRYYDDDDKQDLAGLRSFDYFYFLACHMLERKRASSSTVNLKEGLLLRTFNMIAPRDYSQLYSREAMLIDIIPQDIAVSSDDASMKTYSSTSAAMVK